METPPQLLTTALGTVFDAIAEGVADLTSARAAFVLRRTAAGVGVASGIGVRQGEVIVIGPGDLLGLVLDGGEPVAVQGLARENGPRSEVAEQLFARVPANLLAVPCSTGNGVHGALVAGDREQGAFSVDDIEVATVLASIAGAALLADDSARRPPSASELATSLARLERDDPGRFDGVAMLVYRLISE